MKHVQPTTESRRGGLSGIAAVVALAIASSSFAAQTDISNNPIASSTSAAVKPNIMLLMDASGSMARTHMPDELETTAGPRSIGYKSSQCNVLYYNPAQTYTLPKRYDGTFFPTPSFSSAPYAGFGAYYATPDLSTTNLNNQFVAFDNTSLDVVSPFPDTPQRAYFYVYTGTQTLKFDTQPCTQLDTGATVAAIGGGTWTKTYPVTAAEQENFAIWYSFYRTRISLIKSAASLAFSPLNDTKRVGFITVEPKDTPTASAINPVRYLPVNDFDSTQKNLWFSKLFSQKPRGASPRARRPGPGWPLLRRQGRRHQQRHGCHGPERSAAIRLPAELHHHDHGRLLERPVRDAGWRRRQARRHDARRPARRRPKRSLFAAAFLGRHVFHDARRDQQGQRLQRWRLQSCRALPLDLPDPEGDRQGHEGHDSHATRDDPVHDVDASGRRHERADHQAGDSDDADDGAVRAGEAPPDDRAIPGQEGTGADDQGHPAVPVADEPGRRSDVPDTAGPDPDLPHGRAVDHREGAVRCFDDAVRHAAGPIQDESRADHQAPVPDDCLRPLRRARRRYPGGTASRARALSDRVPHDRGAAAAVRRPGDLHGGSHRFAAQLRQDHLHSGLGHASLRAGRIVHARGHQLWLAELHRQHLQSGQRRPSGRLQRHVHRRHHARRLARLLHLHVYPPGRQQHLDAGGLLHGRLELERHARLDHDVVHQTAGTEQLRCHAFSSLHGGIDDGWFVRHDDMREGGGHLRIRRRAASRTTVFRRRTSRRPARRQPSATSRCRPRRARPAPRARRASSSRPVRARQPGRTRR